jgi:hypothetical protein
MINTLRVQRKFIFDRFNLSRSNSVPNYTPDFVIPSYSLVNNFSISSTIIFHSAPIISDPSIVPIGPSVVSAIIPSSSVPAIIPSSNPSPSIVPVTNIPDNSIPNVSNSLANSQNKNTQADSIVNPSKDIIKTPQLFITQKLKISKKNIRFSLKRIRSVPIFKERRLKNLLV